MADSFPPELARLLGAQDDLSLERGWADFLNVYSPLILHAARTASSGYDEGMDAYASALDQLRANDFRKLRGYSPDPRSRFSTWLVVVVRRSCIDRQRERYGRSSKAERETGSISDERIARKRLADLTASKLDLESIPDSHGTGPEEMARRSELSEALETAVRELDERDQLLLTLRFVDDLSAREVAELQGWNDQMAVYRRIAQITAVLRGKLLSRGVDTSVP